MCFSDLFGRNGQSVSGYWLISTWFTTVLLYIMLTLTVHSYQKLHLICLKGLQQLQVE